MVLTSSEIAAYVGTLLWPFFRVTGMVMTAPVFAARTVPVRIRLGLSVAITAMILPILPAVPTVELFSPTSFFLIAQQLLIGVLMGFTLQLVLAAIVTGGQVVAMQMGLGFAAMVDPQNGAQTPVLSQFYVIMVVLIYLAMNGHLVLIEVLVDSFKTMPVAMNGLVPEDFNKVVHWAAILFSGAVAMAIPAIASLLIVNFTFGIMTRAAPQMNIFAIGFPLTMLLGFGVVFATLPSIVPQSSNLFTSAYRLLKAIIGGV
ncbi:MAG: flagellar biosynthetic protein FliR [Thioalkalispiraceae bacterium]|jgi:flagellar biosynthetic protein FliR